MVAANGYTILRSEPLRVVPLKGPTHRTRPFHKYPGLFKQFAAFEPTPEGAVKFASKFGLLQQQDQGNDFAEWARHMRDFAELTALNANSNLTTPSDLQRSALENVNRIVCSGITVEISETGGVVVKPHSLLAAMAFQLGLWFGTHDESIGQCEECGTTWVYGPGTGHRVNRRYCSINCQDAVRYRRKRDKLGAFWRKKPPPGEGRRSGSGGD